MNCASICAPDVRLVCDRPHDHDGDHGARHPDGGRAEWPDGWGVSVGIPSRGPLEDPNVPEAPAPAEDPGE